MRRRNLINFGDRKLGFFEEPLYERPLYIHYDNLEQFLRREINQHKMCGKWDAATILFLVRRAEAGGSSLVCDSIESSVYFAKVVLWV